MRFLLLRRLAAASMDVYLALIVATNLFFFAATLACVWLLKRRVRRLESGDTDDRVVSLRVALIDTCVAVGFDFTSHVSIGHVECRARLD